MTQKPPSAGIEWDASTLTCAGPGGYARIARVDGTHLLMSVEISGRSYVRHSIDNGRSWGEPILVAAIEHGSAANPKLLVRGDRSIWLLYNERPRAGTGHFTIRMSISHDAGKTWTPRAAPLFIAGTRPEEGCWEPAAIETSDGEILILFANEFPYPHSGEQEIAMLRSIDGGETFSGPTRFAFRPGARDGMPVPTLLKNGSLAVAIEDGGLTPDGQMKPVILSARLALDATSLPIVPGSEHRWSAIERDWPTGLYVGAPYLRTLPDGTTILSSQSTEFDTYPRMVVYVGDADAKHFGAASEPFPVDAGHRGQWNALFVKSKDTITAVSGTTIGGKSGIWTIDGHVSESVERQ